ncbi:hypothetical protein FDI40_gp085 [Agrobacterium phage Atu_ph07]|uniref:Uncharacterized protein n=1 Tax=Agrobacterium phage Atu_ph07 TaxID=2024264 RepID=A0A2L0UZB3_9CAUD|nr:hypothetical protein FDI40_gp085 [Agrobacterium phage Atu_ph07]AUZ94892.1 hypothetical protein [Agrobacterium phage Atu_ph07]
MTTYINVAQLDRPKNMLIQHKIPLKTLVEVNLHYSDHHGIRGYVCEHTRDCDGSPLYSIYYSNDFDTLEYVRTEKPELYRFMVCDGFSDDCLVVIRTSE